MKVLIELHKEEYEAIIRWLNYLRNNILKVSSPEGYHQVTHLVNKLQGENQGVRKHEN